MGAIRERWESKGRNLRRVQTNTYTVAEQADAPLPAAPPAPPPAAPPAPPSAGSAPVTPSAGSSGVVPDPVETKTDAFSPIQSPLAELSPRFACQGDSEDTLLSPTSGQAELMAADLKGAWKFADVISQKEPTSRQIGPPQSIYLLVRTGEDGRIEEVRYESAN